MRHINDKKITYCLIALILLITLINTLAYTRFGYPFGGDQALSNFNFRLIQYSFYIWNPINFSGFYNPSLTSSIELLLSMFFSIIQSIFGILFTNTFYLWFYYSTGAVGMFLLIKDLAIKENSGISNPIIYFGGIVGAMLFSLHFDYHLMAYGIPVYFIPFFLLSFEKLIFANKVSYKYLSLSIIMFSLVLAIGGSYIIQEIIFFFVFAVPVVILVQGKRIRNFIYTAIIFLFGILIEIPVIFSSYYLKYAVPYAYTSLISTNYIFNLKNEILLPLLSFGPSFKLETVLMSPYDISLFVTLLSILIISFFTLSISRNKKRGFVFVIPTFLEIIIFVLFGLGFNKPFGLIFKALVDYLPELVVFRYWFFATHFVFLFSFSFLFGYASIKLLGIQKKKLYFEIILVVLLFVFLSYIYLVDYLPISYGSYSIGGAQPKFVSNAVNLPNHVLLISKYISSENGNFNVGLLPLPGFWELSNYYEGIDIYTSLITKPVFTGGASAQNQFFTVESQPIYSKIGYYLDNSNLNQTNLNLSAVLGILGIKYMVVQGNTINGTFGPYSEQEFNLSKLYKNLNASEGLVLLRRYGNSSIFENINYLPLIYTSNIYNIGNATTNQIISSIENRYLTKNETSIYSVYTNELYNITTINASHIDVFSKPKIAFAEDNPTKVTVHVSNATTPYYLVFRETYDPHWAAFYANGTEVNQSDHIAVNGFANAWYMNKTGNYTITLYYTLQTDAWIAWGVSIAALFVTIGIGVYGWKETKREKRVKKVNSK